MSGRAGFLWAAEWASYERQSGLLMSGRAGFLWAAERVSLWAAERASNEWQSKLLMSGGAGFLRAAGRASYEQQSGLLMSRRAVFLWEAEWASLCVCMLCGVCIYNHDIICCCCRRHYCYYLCCCDHCSQILMNVIVRCHNAMCHIRHAITQLDPTNANAFKVMHIHQAMIYVVKVSAIFNV